MAEYDRAQFHAWLTESCERQGVPVVVTDPAVIKQVAVLLGQPVTRRGKPHERSAAA